jgi:hypothetical protein
MTHNSTSFKPGKSGNPSGRPKGVRTLARLIDAIGDETLSGTEEDFRTMTIRRLWRAAATGKLDLGKTSRQLKPKDWSELVQWLVGHMDKVAIEQWDSHGLSQTQAEIAWEKAREAQESVEEGEPEAARPEQRLLPGNYKSSQEVLDAAREVVLSWGGDKW